MFSLWTAYFVDLVLERFQFQFQKLFKGILIIRIQRIAKLRGVATVQIFAGGVEVEGGERLHSR